MTNPDPDERASVLVTYVFTCPRYFKGPPVYQVHNWDDMPPALVRSDDTYCAILGGCFPALVRVSVFIEA